jgi:hypothetical protein
MKRPQAKSQSFLAGMPSVLSSGAVLHVLIDAWQAIRGYI